MRKSITTIVSICALLLAGPLHWPRKVLDMIGTVETGLSLPDISDPIISLIARYPGFTTDFLPMVLVAAALASLALIHVWPNAVPDLLHRKRLLCAFDPAIAGCVVQGTATPGLPWPGGATPTRMTNLSAFSLMDQTATTSAISFRRNPAGSMIGETRKYFRLRVKAAKRYEIERCAAALVIVKTDDGSIIYDGGPIALTIAPAERQDPEHKDIEIGREEFVDLVYVTQRGDIGIGSRMVPHSMSWAEAFAKPGAFYLKVIVNAAECQPVERTILLDWTGDWQTTAVWQVA